MSASLKLSPESFGRNVGRKLDIIKNNVLLSYWIGFFTDPLTIIFLLIWDVAFLGSNAYLLTASFVAGLTGWTLLEYCFHRWIYHKGRTLAHAGHAMHHEDPKLLIGMPWFLNTSVYMGVWYIFTYWLEVRYVSGFSAGVLAGGIWGGCSEDERARLLGVESLTSPARLREVKNEGQEPASVHEVKAAQ